MDKVITVPLDLRCNWRINPVGIARKTPTLSWRLASGVQTGYQIEVARSFGDLTQGKVDVAAENRIPHILSYIKSRGFNCNTFLAI